MALENRERADVAVLEVVGDLRGGEMRAVQQIQQCNKIMLILVRVCIKGGPGSKRLPFEFFGGWVYLCILAFCRLVSERGKFGIERFL